LKTLGTKEKIEKRLAELKKEYEAGKTRIHQLGHEMQETREVVLRISSAMQVLEEMLQKGKEQNLPK
jgi:hypothetical protein